jgi:hypothetical protein
MTSIESKIDDAGNKITIICSIHDFGTLTFNCERGTNNNAVIMEIIFISTQNDLLALYPYLSKLDEFDNVMSVMHVNSWDGGCATIFSLGKKLFNGVKKETAFNSIIDEVQQFASQSIKSKKTADYANVIKRMDNFMNSK